jgi:hypothetical protein
MLYYKLEEYNYNTIYNAEMSIEIINLLEIQRKKLKMQRKNRQRCGQVFSIRRIANGQ